MSTFLNLQAIDLSQQEIKPAAQLSLQSMHGCVYNPQYTAWQIAENGGSMRYSFGMARQCAVSLTLNVCSMTVGSGSNNPIDITVNGKTLVAKFDDHNYNFHPVTFLIPAAWTQQGNNDLVVQLDPAATSRVSFHSIGVWGEVLPKQAIDFSIPNPSQTDNLSLPLYQGAGFDDYYRAWQLLVGGGFMKLNLDLVEPIATLLTLNECSMTVGSSSNNPFTITVNDRVLVAAFDDHNYNFHDVVHTIPAEWLRAGSNEIRITLDNNATSKVSFKSVGVQGVVLASQSMDLGVPEVSPTANLALASAAGCGYNSSFRSWQIERNGGAMQFNLKLAEPVDVTWTQTECSMTVGPSSANPISIKVNGQTLVSGFDDHNYNFHPVTWTIPYQWLKAGDNNVTISLDDNARSKVSISRVTVSGGYDN